MWFNNVAEIALALSLMPVLMPVPGPSVSHESAEEITKEEILAAGQEWQENYNKYEPEADIVEALKPKLGPGMKIDVYLGLWCKDSQKNVPVLIKILDRAGSAVPVRYFDLPRKKDKNARYFIEDLKVDRVPTFIFYRDGKEIGRIVENPKMGMIEDIAEIVLK